MGCGQGFERVNGIARAATIEFDGRNREGIVARGRKPEHGESIGGGGEADAGLVRGGCRRH